MCAMFRELHLPVLCERRAPCSASGRAVSLLCNKRQQTITRLRLQASDPR